MKNTILLAGCISLTCSAASATLRINELGYRPVDVKTAVYLGDIPAEELTFFIGNSPADSVVAAPAWGNIPYAARIYFTSAAPGQHILAAVKGTDTVESRTVKVAPDVYSARSLRELPLIYLRQQRCGYNPVHNALCHQHDGIRVLSGDADGDSVDVRGGWHDASDYLQYLPTSANTVYNLLFAYKANLEGWADSYDALGRPGANGIPDVLDEARWGLEWMQRMNPAESVYLNQIADDRDHRFVGLPAADSVDYGWGKGGARPVYPVSGNPYGLQRFKNRSTGEASSVAKFASSFGLGAKVFADIDSSFAADLNRRAQSAYAYALAHPGASQTAPCSSPYFYEEDNWVDDVELAGATLGHMRDAAAYGRLEPVTPWMGADTARHYQWYPFINLGHAILAADADSLHRAEFAALMRKGLEMTTKRGAGNAFRNGVPFVWCSNNLAVGFVSQAMLYRMLTGDDTFAEDEAAVRDWLFGLNPWGQIMLMLPEDWNVPSPQDPHSAMTDRTVAGRPGRDWLVGGLVDGPVYSSIFNALWGVHLRRPDTFAPYHGRAVYHDDYSDYSTNEPTMDGTASLCLLLSLLNMD